LGFSGREAIDVYFIVVVSGVKILSLDLSRTNAGSSIFTTYGISLGPFAKLRKATINFVMSVHLSVHLSVCLSVRMESVGSRRTDFDGI
jgi:hypothetical protein